MMMLLLLLLEIGARVTRDVKQQMFFFAIQTRYIYVFLFFSSHSDHSDMVDDEDEEVVHRERVLGQPPGEELPGELAPLEPPHPQAEEDRRADVGAEDDRDLLRGGHVRVARDHHDVEQEDGGRDADRHPPRPHGQVEGALVGAQHREREDGGRHG